MSSKKDSFSLKIAIAIYIDGADLCLKLKKGSMK
jgi:hypothetical protein